ncbi:hypothetical protein D1007_16138 [Hordeum vulgare]|nr:hypothetical protein D1007_16138 [Hordeum vulgare]
MNMRVLERSMPKAWGLHQEARFKIIGADMFFVNFGSEGDWKHVLNNSPWQFDFHALVIKDYDGATRHSEVAARRSTKVEDLPLYKRSKAFGEAMWNWLREVVHVDVDKDGSARGSHLHFMVKFSVFEPLMRGFYLKIHDDDLEKTWFDFKYEKILYFCFEYGRLVHGTEGCLPPVDSDQQCGEWLKASQGHSASMKGWSHKGATNNANSFGSVRPSEGTESWKRTRSVRDLPTKHNLNGEFNNPAASCTGGGGRMDQEDVSSPNKPRDGPAASEGKDLKEELGQKRERDICYELRQLQLG